ncbi:hypothetical protein GCM10010215_26080 [Streptomyces virginiae]|uniref:Uncharacterized protein n=1 Tax=Streptomyces virginiae TaxID=1961 RepID=A0ABQ3NN65_STRVG|nr:hypothetical protein GCM10010215_26080 [Streptomyces virginiae]GHI14213.1 hypothetical protein Scinn_36760 [Streptomyces virginiae]
MEKSPAIWNDSSAPDAYEGSVPVSDSVPVFDSVLVTASVPTVLSVPSHSSVPEPYGSCAPQPDSAPFPPKSVASMPAPSPEPWGFRTSPVRPAIAVRILRASSGTGFPTALGPGPALHAVPVLRS